MTGLRRKRLIAMTAIPHVDRALDLIEELSKVPQQDLRYQLRKLRDYRDALFATCPFKEGDQIRLKHDYVIGSSSGWRGCERMMCKGATAVVYEVDWIKRPDREQGRFVISVVFDNEFRDSTWGDEVKTYVKTGEDRHIFMFGGPERDWEPTT